MKQTGLMNMLLETVSSLRQGKRLAFSAHAPGFIPFFVSSMFRKIGRTILVIMPTYDDAERFVADSKFYSGEDEVLLFPPWEVLPFEGQSPHPETVSLRMGVLYKLVNERPVTLVCTPRSLLQKVLPSEVFIGAVEIIKQGAIADLNILTEKLSSIGYSRLSIVEERGEMSVRGGIIDLFPPLYSQPVRIELFGDMVESIRFFDPVTQLSGEVVNELSILPSREMIMNSDLLPAAMKRLKKRSDEMGLARDVRDSVAALLSHSFMASGIEFLLPLFYPAMDSVFDYLPPDCLTLFCDANSIEEETKLFKDEIKEMSNKRAEKNLFFVEPCEFYLTPDVLWDSFSDRPCLYFNSGVVCEEEIELGVSSNTDIRQEISVRREKILLPLSGRLLDWLETGWRVIIVVSTEGQAERLGELLANYGICTRLLPVARKGAFFNQGDEVQSAFASVPIVVGNLSYGFKLEEDSIAIITESEIFGDRLRRRPPPSRKLDSFLMQLQDLNKSDLVVHAEHGIGLYKGIKRIMVGEVESDFLILEYKDGDKLYLPAQRLNLISKYRGGSGGNKPPVDKLGGKTWKKVKGRVKEAVEKMAIELLNLYASRQVTKGFSFSMPENLYSEFEASFEYDETEDQAKAINDMLNDMISSRPMDRLICGDVGYGKTEVAMRGAFKAVLDGKQVAMIVPTTVLAQQHHNTFTRRFAGYPVKIGVLSRFRTNAEQRETIRLLKNGEINIVIGTHRLLQRDIYFKDIGLLIIDEEHRFGVSHKERLKQIRKNLDVLTLTATPIPRTLHMSLAGMRELSIINTPPEDRLSIKTVVAQFDEALIRNAVVREISRGGQIFFVHNRVSEIGSLQNMLMEILPEVKIIVAHGQMKARELEDVMVAFVNKEYDILLSTSIIESGLDIPSANTIIINRADRFGLSEIYQLRGRVGRTKQRAYAYLLVPSRGVISVDGLKRLEVLREFGGLGSGFRIAAHDLEIRGAGELIGKEQSGHIAAVGFEMYNQLLGEEIGKLKGEKIEERKNIEIKFNVSAYIPEQYLPDVKQRLNVYKRISSVKDSEDLADMKIEFRDRFGRFPDVVLNLFRMAQLRMLCERAGISEILQKGSKVYFRVPDGIELLRDMLEGASGNGSGKVSTAGNSRLVYLADRQEDTLAGAINLLKQVVKE